MDRRRLYLDHNAGAPLLSAARAAMVDALAAPGNPSSVHGEGRAARRRVEEARRAVAGLLAADPRFVTFTSGGSEAAVTVLTPHWFMNGRPLAFDRLLVSAVEHPCVGKGGRFAADRVETIPVDGDGVVDLAALERRLSDIAAIGERPLVSVMLANNETGVIEPLAEVARLVHAVGGLVHSDMAQAAGRMAVDLPALGVDVATLSAHKLGGPQGAGAIVRASDMIAFTPLITGGGQESQARAGTQNVAAIAGFGAAAREMLARRAEWDGVAALRDRLEAGLLAATPAVRIFCAGRTRLPNTSCFALEGLAAETALIAFDLAGIALSSGSACSSGKVAPSHVLAAMGVGPDMSGRALRVGLGLETAAADVERFLAEWVRISAQARTSSRDGVGSTATGALSAA